MTVRDVSFRTIAKFAGNDSCLSNTLVAEQIIYGYVATQVLAVRRLVDKRADVISLRRLIKDVRQNFGLFTRENYVCYDGQPYDYETAMQQEIGGLASAKGRLIRCTVPGSTPKRLAMMRTPALPGVARASRIRFSSAGAIGGTPEPLTLTPGPRKPGTDSFHDHRPLEFGKNAQHLKHCLPGGRRRVEALLAQE
jgi:hypothetical protein